jgi:ABC-type nitrate/sulfonate/bicarbonate transport system substrate-binding protein
MLRRPQHERKILNDIKTPPFVTSINSVQALSLSKDSDWSSARAKSKLLAGRVILVLALLSCIFAANASAQGTKLTVSYSADTPGQLSAWMAKETGIYSKNGLDVQLIRATGNVAVMALLSGEVGIGVMGGASVIESNLRGSDSVMIASGQVITDYVLVAQSKMKTAEQLKGGILGVASLSGSSVTASRFALRKLGLDADKDVSIIVVGGTPDRLIALQTGRIQATLLSPPTSIVAEREGFTFLTDVGDLPFPYNSLASTRRFVRENPETVRKYIKSHIEAVHRLKTDRETGIKVLGKYLRRSDRYLLEKSYDASVADNILPRKQYPSLPAIKTVLEMLSERTPKARSTKPEEFFDVRFIKELDDSGFIDNLYRRQRN